MNSQRMRLTLALAAVAAAGALSACTSTVDGQAVASSAAGATPETTLSNNVPGGIGDAPPQYTELMQDIASAREGVVAFWKRNGVDLDAVRVAAVEDETHAPCVSSRSFTVDAWTCPNASPPAVATDLPRLQEEVDRGGRYAVWFVVGHEFGHMASYQRGYAPGDENREALADCLSGAAAAGSGTASQVTEAVADLYGRNSTRHQVVQHGVNNGADACFIGAR